MAGYAAFADVQARAGLFAGALDRAGKRPTRQDVEGFITDVSAEIDAAVRAGGFDPAALSDATRAALRDVAAYGALTRALPSVADGSKEADNLLARADTIYTRAVEAMAAGKHAALAAVEAGAGGGGAGSGAGSWASRPGIAEEALAPMWVRGQPV